jgi:aryl-alcohol dehydrogenase-like predicted oxidoreductase
VLALREVAGDLGLTRAQLALAWVLRQKGVSSAITGASNPKQLQESLGAAGVDLTPDVVGRIEKILNPSA